MAIKGVLNILAGYDNLGNPVYASIYPKSTIDQIENLAQHIENRIDAKISEIPLTAKNVNGTIKIGDNISVVNGVAYLQKTDIFGALGYVPVPRGSLEDSTIHADKLTNAQVIQGVKFDGSKAIVNYGICQTSANVEQKTVELIDFALIPGSEIIVTFANGNEALNPTLNVNDTGEKSIYYLGLPFKDIKFGTTYHLVYDGQHYQLIGDINTHLIHGVKGDAEEEYRTGFVNINKAHIGLGNVDNTADINKKVSAANFATNDEYGKRIAYTYFTNYEAEVLAEEVLAEEDNNKKQFADINNKYLTTNRTFADLRKDIVVNTNGIKDNKNSIKSLNEISDEYEIRISLNSRRIDDILEELTYIHEDITSAYEVGQQGLTTANDVATKLVETNLEVNTAQETADRALQLIGELDTIAERAEQDINGNVIHETYAPLASPAFMGSPEIPTAPKDNNSKIIANTEFVNKAIEQALSNINPESLATLESIKELIDSDPNFKATFFTTLANKQDKDDTLSNLCNTNLGRHNILYTTGPHSFATSKITPYALDLLRQVDAYAARVSLNALGKEEKAASAVVADTATNCVGNSLTANTFAVGREIVTTDGINRSLPTLFDGSKNIAIQLPKIIHASLNGTADNAISLIKGKTINVNLASHLAVPFDNTVDIHPGVSGILAVENGGTGKDNLKDIHVGSSNQVIANIEDVIDAILVTAKDDFGRVRMGIDEISEKGFIEIATADNANEPIYVRQYFGKFDTPHRTLTLLDSAGNTNIPGTLTMESLIIPTKRPEHLVNGMIWLEDIS